MSPCSRQQAQPAQGKPQRHRHLQQNCGPCRRSFLHQLEVNPAYQWASETMTFKAHAEFHHDRCPGLQEISLRSPMHNGCQVKNPHRASEDGIPAYRSEMHSMRAATPGADRLDVLEPEQTTIP